MASQRPRHSPRNTQMAESLSKVRRDIQVKTQGFSHLKFPSVNSWKADSEDHINIWEFGKVELGQLLSVNFSLPFKHPILGKFKSIRGLWIYVTTKEQDDALRNMDSRHIRDYVKKVDAIKIKNFQAIIIDSCYHRIKSTKVLAEAVINSTLPFDCYSASAQGLRTRPAFQRWFVAGMEEVRKALKEKREPDLTFLMDDPTAKLYEEVAPWYYEEREKGTRPRSENSLLSAIIADSKGNAPKPKAPKAAPAESDSTDPAPESAAPVAEKVDVPKELPGVLASNMGASSTLADTSTREEEGVERKPNAETLAAVNEVHGEASFDSVEELTNHLDAEVAAGRATAETQSAAQA